MAGRSNKSIAEILTQSATSSLVDNIELQSKIASATEGFTTKFCELVLRDRERISQENVLTICDYIIAMKREVNPRPSYKRNTIEILSESSRAVGIQKKFIDMTRDDILCYLDKCLKPENISIRCKQLQNPNNFYSLEAIGAVNRFNPHRPFDKILGQYIPFSTPYSSLFYQVMDMMEPHLHSIRPAGRSKMH
jgi:hypothetical protein